MITLMITSIFEVFGVGLIMPFISILTNPEIIYDNTSYLNKIFLSFDGTKENFILTIGIIVFLLLFSEIFLEFFQTGKFINFLSFQVMFWELNY